MSHARWRPNVTVAAYIEGPDGLLWVQERSAAGPRLNNAAGHLELGDASLLDAVCREVWEETGRRFQPLSLLGVYLGEPSGELRYLRFAFVGTVGPREREALDPAIIDTQWLSPAQLRGRAAELRSALVLAGLADYEAGVRHPLTLLHPLP